MNEIKINKWRALFIFSTILNIALIGFSMNMLAVAQNGGKMPVYAPLNTPIKTPQTHFVFDNKCDVNFFLFTDILNYRQTHYSIGDLLITLAIALAVGYYVFYLVTYIWNTIHKLKCREET